MTTILDPTDERVPVRRQLAQRPEQLSGTVAFLDIRKAFDRVCRPILWDRLYRKGITGRFWRIFLLFWITSKSLNLEIFSLSVVNHSLLPLALVLIALILLQQQD